MKEGGQIAVSLGPMEGVWWGDSDAQTGPKSLLGRAMGHEVGLGHGLLYPDWAPFSWQSRPVGTLQSRALVQVGALHGLNHALSVLVCRVTSSSPISGLI